MSKLNSVIFIDNLPRLDLHGFDRDTAILYKNDSRLSRKYAWKYGGNYAILEKLI